MKPVWEQFDADVGQENIAAAQVINDRDEADSARGPAISPGRHDPAGGTNKDVTGRDGVPTSRKRRLDGLRGT